MFDIFCIISCFITQKIYTMPHTSLDSFVNPSVKWPIYSLLIGNLTFCKYDVAVL